MATEVHRHGRNASAERRAAAPLDPDEAGAQRRVVQADHSVPSLREKQPRYDLMAPRIWLHSRDSFTSRDIAHLNLRIVLRGAQMPRPIGRTGALTSVSIRLPNGSRLRWYLASTASTSDGVTTTWSTSTLSQARFSVTSQPFAAEGPGRSSPPPRLHVPERRRIG